MQFALISKLIQFALMSKMIQFSRMPTVIPFTLMSKLIQFLTVNFVRDYHADALTVPVEILVCWPFQMISVVM